MEFGSLVSIVGVITLSVVHGGLYYVTLSSRSEDITRTVLTYWVQPSTSFSRFGFTSCTMFYGLDVR